MMMAVMVVAIVVGADGGHHVDMMHAQEAAGFKTADARTHVHSTHRTRKRTRKRTHSRVPRECRMTALTAV